LAIQKRVSLGLGVVEEKKEEQSVFYETRANYLEEQDKREELSEAVQALAKR